MKNWILGAISITAIIISIVAIANTAPTQGIDFDYLGAIIGVLSFLVTLLIGYQIYTVINVKEELKEIQKAREELDRLVETKVQMSKEMMTEELNNVIPLLVSINLNDPVHVVSTALEVFCEAHSDTLASTFSSGLIAVMMNKVCDYNDEEQKCFLKKLKENSKQADVATYYAYLSKEDAETKKEYEGVDGLFAKLISLYVE